MLLLVYINLYLLKRREIFYMNIIFIRITCKTRQPTITTFCDKAHALLVQQTRTAEGSEKMGRRWWNSDVG